MKTRWQVLPVLALVASSGALALDADVPEGVIPRVLEVSGSRFIRSETRAGLPSIAAAQPEAPAAGRAGTVLWTVLEPQATIDRSGVEMSGNGSRIAAGWSLSSQGVSLYPTTGNGTPTWTYNVDPASLFSVPVGIDLAGATIAGTSSAEPLLQWSNASATPTQTHAWPGSYTGEQAAVDASGTFIVGGGENQSVPNGGGVWVYEANGASRWQDTTIASPLEGIDVSADGTRIAANEYGRANVWNAATGTKIATFVAPGNGQAISRLSQDGAKLLLGNYSGEVRLYQWNGTQYASQWTYPTGDTWVTAIDVSDDASTVMAGTWRNTVPYGGSVYMLDVATGGLLWSDSSYGDQVESVALAADGSRGVAASWGRRGGTQGNIVAVYDRASPTPTYAIADDSVTGAASAFAAAISDDGQYVAVGGKAVHARDFGSGGWLMAIHVTTGGGGTTPTVTDICPDLAQRGSTAIPIRVGGQSFDPAAVLSFAPAGLAVSNVSVVSSTTITADLTIPAGAPVGSYDVEVTNPGPATGTGTGLLTVVDRAFDLLAGPGPGPASGPQVKGFDANGTPLSKVNFFAYGSVGYGVNIAAGDINGGSSTAGAAEIITGPGPGAIYGPQVRAFDRQSGSITKVNFYAYGTLRFGVHVAATDVDCDGFAEIVSGAGPGAVFGPHVRGWNFDNVALTAAKSFNYFAYSTLRFGVHPEAGDVDGDIFDEPLTAPGPGVVFGPQVRGWNYDASAITANSKINVFAFATTTYGASVAGSDADRDGFAELVAAIGPGPAFSADLAGFDYDGGPVAALPGYTLTVVSGTGYGASFTRSGDIDRDGDDEIATGPGPDPTAAETVVLVDYAGGNASISSTFLAFGSGTYGVKVALADLGY